MFIESLHIQGFKSLADVELTDLNAINVFHGQNDTGKSNLLEALDLFCQILPLALSGGINTAYLGKTDLWPYTSDIFRLQESPPRTIVWEAQLRLAQHPSPLVLQLQLGEVGPRDLAETTGEFHLEISWPEGQPQEAILDRLANPGAGFHRIPATRYFQTERVGPKTTPTLISKTRRSPVTATNLKQTLVEAFAGLDEGQAQRYTALEQALAKHFALPGFIARLAPAEDGGQLYVVGFRRAGMKEPLLIESVGSGVQQLILMLGQMLFNPAQTVGIEEPEMNLSPDWQIKLLNVFKALVAPQTGVLEQLFITSHSLAFRPESADYYDVTYDPQAQATLVTRRPLKERRKYFDVLGLTPAEGEELGPYLTPQNQITVPQRVIDDLGLKTYEPVFFVKEELYWRLCTKEELLARMQTEEQTYADQEDRV